MSAHGPPGGVPDDELIRRAADLDEDALAELFDRYSPTALALARRILGPARAEDAVQEAFTSIWRSAATYDPRQGLVRTWLLRIVRYRSIDILRAAHAEDRRVEAAHHDERGGAPAESASDGAIRREERDRVREALALLPGEQREVVELAYYGGLSQAEIAERLELPVGTVKSRARLALEKLRAEMAPTREAAG